MVKLFFELLIGYCLLKFIIIPLVSSFSSKQKMRTPEKPEEETIDYEEIK